MSSNARSFGANKTILTGFNCRNEETNTIAPTVIEVPFLEIKRNVFVVINQNKKRLSPLLLVIAGNAFWVILNGAFVFTSNIDSRSSIVQSKSCIGFPPPALFT